MNEAPLTVGSKSENETKCTRSSKPIDNAYYVGYTIVPRKENLEECEILAEVLM